MYQAVAFTSLKGELLLVHGVGVKLREGVRGAAKRGVHGSIDLVEAGGHRLPLLPHLRRLGLDRWKSPRKQTQGRVYSSGQRVRFRRQLRRRLSGRNHGESRFVCSRKRTDEANGVESRGFLWREKEQKTKLRRKRKGGGSR